MSCLSVLGVHPLNLRILLILFGGTFAEGTEISKELRDCICDLHPYLPSHTKVHSRVENAKQHYAGPEC